MEIMMFHHDVINFHQFSSIFIMIFDDHMQKIHG